MSVMKHFAMTTSKLAPKVTVWAVIFYHISSNFAHRQRRKNLYPPTFTGIWRKKCFRVWQLSTLVPIKMSVSCLTELHTPQQTLGFSFVSKEQPLFKSVTRLNPVFQPIFTVTIVTVNMGWNTVFSLVTDINKCCSLLRVLKLNVWQEACSSVRLDTDIFIGTSALNCQTIKTLFLQILVIKTIFARKLGSIHFFSSTCGHNMSLYGKILLPKQ